MSSITCPDCGMTSHNPNDVRELYCGNCHWWTSDPLLGPARHDPELAPMLISDDPIGGAA